MKKLKIFLLISILLCLGFTLSYEVHAQSTGPKVFEEGDILPSTTQLRISWDWYLDDDDCTMLIKTDTDNFELVSNISGDIYINGIEIAWYDDEGDLYYRPPYTNINGGHPYIDIDTSTWTLAKRTVSTSIFNTSGDSADFLWEDLNAPSGYTISFETNGGTTISDIEEATELPISLPIPTKEKHTFLGWYYDSAFTQKANAGDIIESNVTLYAKWELNAYKPFEIGDELPAGYIKISWDFTGKPIPDEAVTFMVSSGDDVFNDFIIQIDFNYGGYNHLKIFNGGSVEHFNVDTPGFTIITLTESVTITDLAGTNGITSLDYNVYIGDALTWEVVSQDYLNGFIEARGIYGFRYMGGPWMSGEAAWNHGYDKGSEETWDDGFEYGMERYGYYDSNTDEWLSVTEYLNRYGTDKPGQSDFYGNFDKYFIPAMIIVFGGAIVLTILKVFKGRE